MFSIRREQDVIMNFQGSPQCGNAGDMRFKISIEGFGRALDHNGFVFDSFNLFDLFEELERGKWHGSCEGIGIFCAEWLFSREPNITRVLVKVTTESTNQLTIDLYFHEINEVKLMAIRRP